MASCGTYDKIIRHEWNVLFTNNKSELCFCGIISEYFLHKDKYTVPAVLTSSTDFLGNEIREREREGGRGECSVFGCLDCLLACQGHGVIRAITKYRSITDDIDTFKEVGDERVQSGNLNQQGKSGIVAADLTTVYKQNMQFAASVDSLDSGPSCSEPIAISSSAPTVPVDSQKEPLSPVSERYRLKKFHLQQKYDYIYMSNNRLRNRLYHIKKEINHLKRLKRVLCQRLFTFRDPFMDSCLEIPDNDPTSPTIERISSDATGKPSGSSKKKKAAEAKRVNQQVNEVSSMVEIAKNSVISIIDSVITESHEERVRANQNSSGQKTPQQSPNVPALGEVMRNEAGIEGVSEDCEPVIERMLRASSIDHLLPVDPDSDTNNVLTGFGENLEENFMAED
ncbi:hypothetical protein LOAG_02232 [Loa loa]|uniref:Uncharacterized protein n=1 Tax=Loa loa TaxID=7209 RepID=A0A1S0U7X8_LOALO|nr:hypothetical protein LOAG_02232 [Loa loa]EFO26249.2 hypothetical protein LOAG_02232 [Loa loa]